MAEEKLLTVREVSHLLGLTEKDVLELAENGSVPAYKVAGVYLRFKSDQVHEYLKKNKAQLKHHDDSPAREKVLDFFYFYDFYIFALALSAILVYIIVFK